MNRLRAWHKAIKAEVDAGRSIVVVEPPAGLSDSDKAAIQVALNLMADGETRRAQALLAEYGFAFEVSRVEKGRLTPVERAVRWWQRR